MRSTFENDPYPGRARILFIGHPLSTHVHAWIDLLAGSEINVRFFAIPDYPPPADWPIRTYLPLPNPPEGLDPNTRNSPRHTHRPLRPEKWLAEIVTDWRPHIIHVFGIDPASFAFSEAINGLDRSECAYTWVVQTRGGSDLTLTRTDPEVSPRIRAVLEECDQIITDNKKNFEYLHELGVPSGKIAEIAPVPGTGGIDMEEFSDSRKTPPSKRERLILWPKAYECPWSKALPVLEAIKEAWEKIKPCKIYMLASEPEVRQWFYTLPREIRSSCHIDKRIPRDGVLELMGRARVMLAPSLVDGIPNSLYEAMACGAFPIVSPLETISTVVKNEENVLFARNMYPGEIAEALVRAMNDDRLVDEAVIRNISTLRTHADRAAITRRVVGYYEGLHENIDAQRKTKAKGSSIARTKKFAFVSHVVPPSWSGQAVMIGRLLRRFPKNAYCLISTDANVSDRQNRFISGLQGAYHYLPKEPRSASRTSGLLARLDTLLALFLRSLRIVRLLKHEGCSAVVAATGDLIDIPAAYFASRLLRIPFYAYLFDDYVYQWPDGRRAAARLFESITVRKTAGVIVPNEFMEQEIKKRYSGKVHVIHNPCETLHVGDNSRRPMVGRDEVEIVYTGAVYHVNYASFRLLLAAIDKTGSPRITLHLYTADSPDALEKEHISGPRVVYHNHVPSEQVIEVLRLYDVAFMPFSFNSIVSEVIKTSAPGKLGDYLASGIPILANVPPDSFVSWYLKKWRCGLVVDVDEVGPFALAINRLVNDADLQADMSRHAIERARIDFDPEKASGQLLSALGILQ